MTCPKSKIWKTLYRVGYVRLYQYYIFPQKKPRCFKCSSPIKPQLILENVLQAPCPFKRSFFKRHPPP